MTVEADIHAALIGQVAVMAAGLSIEIVYPQKDTDTPAVEHVRAYHLPADNFEADLSSDVYQRQGLLQLTHVADLDTYEIVTKERCGLIAGYFKRGLNLSTEIEIVKTSVSSGRQEAGRWETPIKIEYRGIV